MNNLKNEVICDECEDNILDVGIIDFGHIYLKYSGGNQFKKGEFVFSFAPAQCGGCREEISEKTASKLSKFYSSVSDLNFKDIINSSIWFSKLAYTPQFCHHCGVDINEEGLNYLVILNLNYDSLKDGFAITNVELYSGNIRCGNCDENLTIYETIEYAKKDTNNRVVYEIPLPKNIFY